MFLFLCYEHMLHVWDYRLPLFKHHRRQRCLISHSLEWGTSFFISASFTFPFFNRTQSYNCSHDIFLIRWDLCVYPKSHIQGLQRATTARNYVNAVPLNHVCHCEHIMIADKASNKLINTQWALRAYGVSCSVCTSPLKRWRDKTMSKLLEASTACSRFSFVFALRFLSIRNEDTSNPKSHECFFVFSLVAFTWRIPTEFSVVGEATRVFSQQPFRGRLFSSSFLFA